MWRTKTPIIESTAILISGASLPLIRGLLIGCHGSGVSPHRAVTLDQTDVTKEDQWVCKSVWEMEDGRRKRWKYKQSQGPGLRQSGLHVHRSTLHSIHPPFFVLI